MRLWLKTTFLLATGIQNGLAERGTNLTLFEVNYQHYLADIYQRDPLYDVWRRYFDDVLEYAKK
ncbi:hypothetical protein SAMN05421858_4806 [Haladaptatus litoreus]|uniref:Uncharacterized protein n=1 Tax=Haladaptatus litoreus TaxID=553468 RepID=A0A1N7F874_9EURY|nr:hypothetical protein SAMN05421858_4806 [Haladaptatus litoreus]